MGDWLVAGLTSRMCLQRTSKLWQDLRARPRLVTCFHSSGKEVGRLRHIAIDVNHEVCEALPSIHHVLLQGRHSLILILLRRNLSSCEVYLVARFE